jgi:hypothetical protein
MQLIILVLTHRWINKLEKHQGMDKEDNTPIPENTWWVCVTPGILRELVELCTWIQISRIHHTRWLTSHNRPYKNEVTTQDKEGNRQNFDHVQIKVLSYPTCKRRVFLFLSTSNRKIYVTIRRLRVLPLLDRAQAIQQDTWHRVLHLLKCPNRYKLAGFLCRV